MKTQKLPCFGYNMSCKGNTHWIEDNICFILGPLSNAYERKGKEGIFQRRLFSNVVGDIHFIG